MIWIELFVFRSTEIVLHLRLAGTNMFRKLAPLVEIFPDQRKPMKCVALFSGLRQSRNAIGYLDANQWTGCSCLFFAPRVYNDECTAISTCLNNDVTVKHVFSVSEFHNVHFNCHAPVVPKTRVSHRNMGRNTLLMVSGHWTLRDFGKAPSLRLQTHLPHGLLSQWRSSWDWRKKPAALVSHPLFWETKWTHVIFAPRALVVGFPVSGLTDWGFELAISLHWHAREPS